MTSPTTNVAFYADFQGLASLKNDAKAQHPAALKEAAKQFESLFTQMLLKSMREANKSFGDSMFGSEQADFYQDMFDDQIAVHLSKGKGLGLADMLIRQLAGVGASQPASQAEAPSADAGLQTSGSVGKSHAHDAIWSSKSASKSEFVRSLMPHAEAAAREIGVDPHALLAQAALETGWGKAVPSTAAGESSFNLFGIKAGGHWSGATVNVPTLEFEDGVAVRKVERFRAYSSAADSFRDYASLVRDNPRYGAALGAGGDVAAFAAALQKGGYATDPDYARKIVAVAEQLRGIGDAGQLKQAAAMPLLSDRGGA